MHIYIYIYVARSFDFVPERFDVTFMMPVPWVGHETCSWDHCCPIKWKYPIRLNHWTKCCPLIWKYVDTLERWVAVPEIGPRAPRQVSPDSTYHADFYPDPEETVGFCLATQRRQAKCHKWRQFPALPTKKKQCLLGPAMISYQKNLQVCRRIINPRIICYTWGVYGTQCMRFGTLYLSIYLSIYIYMYRYGCTTWLKAKQSVHSQYIYIYIYTAVVDATS